MSGLKLLKTSSNLRQSLLVVDSQEIFLSGVEFSAAFSLELIKESLEETGVSKLELADHLGHPPGSCQSSPNNRPM